MEPESRPWYRAPYGLAVVWAVLPFALVGLGFGLQPLKSWDYWWHIAFGRMIAETGEMPMHAHWLYTMPADAPGYVQPWISQWLLYLLHETFGLHAVLLLRNGLAMFGFGALGLWAGRRAKSMPVGAILTLLASAFGFFTVAARSHLLAWPLFLVVLPVAYALRTGKLPRPWLLLFPLVTGVWANLHGTFPVTPVVCVAFAAAEFFDARLGRRERYGPSYIEWGVACVASLLATLANPRGWEVWGYLWTLSVNQELRMTVSEWWPALPWSPEYFGPLFWVMLVVALVQMWRHRERLDLADLFMVLWIAILTIPQTRFMLWFALAYPIAMARYCGGLASQFSEEGEPSKVMQGVHVVVAVGLVLLAFAVQPWTSEHTLAAEIQAAPTRTEPPAVGLAQAEAPYEAVGLIKARFADTPRLFHDHQNPGFLLWALDARPFQQLVFVDNRIEMPSQQVWRRFDAIGRGEGYSEAFEEFEVDAVVASHELQPGLITALQADEAWERPFDNELYSVFWRKTPLRAKLK